MVHDVHQAAAHSVEADAGRCSKRNCNTGEYVSHVRDARVGKHPLEVGLNPCHQVAAEHGQHRKQWQRQADESAGQYANRLDHSDQASRYDDTRQHGADAARGCAVSIGQPGVHGHDGGFHAETSYEQGCDNQSQVRRHEVAVVQDG